jgi:hypothetical protein
MITNPEVIKNKYSCNKFIADYLIYEKHLSLLGQKGDVYYFTYSTELVEILKNLPIWLKVMKIF